MQLSTFRAIVDHINADVSSYWTGVTNAISESSNVIGNSATATVAQYEKFGKSMLDIAADYSRGLSVLADGAGSATERAALREVASDLSRAIDNIRQGGVDAYARVGAASAME